jgi:hypothetical protein
MMKNLIVSLLLIEMILLPFPTTGFNSVAFAEGDSETTCSQGEVFNSSLNRCVLSTQTVEDKTNARNCEGLDGDAYKDCFNQNVDKEMAEAESDGDVKGASDPEKKYGIPAAVTLTAAYLLWKKSDVLKECGQTSMWLMLGGGLSSLLGEFMAQKKYNDTISGLADDYKSRMSEKPSDESEESEVVESINDNQVLAFDFQIEQEEARKKAHKARKNAYNLAFGLYTASVVASLYDAWGNSQGCQSASLYTPTRPPRNYSISKRLQLNYGLFGEYYFLEEVSQDEFKELVVRKIASIFLPSAHAGPPAPTPLVQPLPPANVAVPPINLPNVPIAKTTMKDLTLNGHETSEVMKSNADSSTFGEKVDSAIKNPYFRAAIGGILAGYSKKVANDAGDLEDEAGERVDLLNELKASFDANGGAGFGNCSAADRKSTSNPACYCFLSDGNRDPGKSKSGICDGVYGKASNLAATDYNKNYGLSKQGVKGCFTKTKKFDPDCKCKADVDKSGNDDCLRINGKLKLGSLGSIRGLKDMMKKTVDFTQGNISTAELGSGATEDLALRLKKAKDQLSKNPKYKKKMKNLALLEKKLKRNISSSFKKGLSNGSISNPFGGGLNGAIKPVSAKDALKNMKSSVKRKTAKFKSGGNLAGGKKKSGMGDYDFGGSKGKAGVDIDDIDGVMKKEYSFNDINENPDNSIFKIITNRYHRSGLRRLFDDEGISKADTSNGNDINEK